MISTALIFKTVTKTVIYRLVEADIGYNRTSLIQTIFPEFSQKCEGGHVGYGLNKYREIGCWAGCFNVKNYGYICHPSLHLHLPLKSFSKMRQNGAGVAKEDQHYAMQERITLRNSYPV